MNTMINHDSEYHHDERRRRTSKKGRKKDKMTNEKIRALYRSLYMYAYNMHTKGCRFIIIVSWSLLTKILGP